MLKSGQKRPNTPSVTKSIADSQHWIQGVGETVLVATADGSSNFSVAGGSDYGQFAYVDDIDEKRINYLSGRLHHKDILLEVQGQKVAGYTQRDVVAWIQHSARGGNPVTLKTTKADSIPCDLRVFLNTCFQKGSVDHDLQNTIRDNLYLRTVPVTTRPPRDGEVDGVDYTFLSLEEFSKLERSGNLLESGIYEGNHYGTPKPSKEAAPGGSSGSGAAIGVGGGGGAATGPGAVVLSGAHPSSEGKRKRNRSNVEAMAAKSMEPESESDQQQSHTQTQTQTHTQSPDGGPNSSNSAPPVAPPSYSEGRSSSREDIGPLPTNWEKAYTERGEVYFIDHNTGTSHWLDPRLSKFQKKSLEECLDDELPYGWEKIDDPQYGTYYIDHVNRCTQYENPVIQAKRAVNDSETPESLIQEVSEGSYPQYKSIPENSLLSSAHSVSGSHNAQPSSSSSKRNRRGVERRGERRGGRGWLRKCVRCLADDETMAEARNSGRAALVSRAGAGVGAVLGDGGEVKGKVGVAASAAVTTSQGAGFGDSAPPSLNQTIVPKFAKLSFPYSYPLSRPGSDAERAFFTRNPMELEGQRIRTTLVKSARGLGFTIVGGDDLEEEFLQIKSVVPNGSAWIDGKLQTGDVLVFVNDTCVLGFTHHDMVSMFQSIAPGETVTLEVCRGYPLPFDPNDPNTEVVTTVAVNAPDPVHGDVGAYMYRNGELSNAERGYHLVESSEGMHAGLHAGMHAGMHPGMHAGMHTGSDDLVNSSVKSMPDLCGSNKMVIPRPSSTDLLSRSTTMPLEPPVPAKPEFLTISIVKGDMGFGFTIADSAYGQKVKKILDRMRCKTLQEGDILVEINAINVRNMCHADVVQVLKDCPRNLEATVTVQRGSSSAANKNKARKKEDIFGPNNRKTSYRSKTPTADLYSTQPKEVVPTRPKTPLVDTRNRVKTPTNANGPLWLPNEALALRKEGDDKSADPQPQTLPQPLQSPASTSLSAQYDGYQTTAFPFLYDAKMATLGNCLASTSLGSPDDYNRSQSPGNDLDAPLRGGLYHPEDTQNTSDSNMSADYLRHQPYYNGYKNSFDQYGYGYGYRDAQPGRDYSSASAYLTPNPEGIDYYQTNNKGKESTSFEHELPLSSPVTRYPMRRNGGGVSGNSGVCPSGGIRAYPAEPGMDWVETTVTLVRQEAGFGFRIVGGTEEGSQVGAMVSIGHIVPGGAADLDGRLCTGDEIVSVDGLPVLSTSHHHVVQLMGHAANTGRVILGIRRRVPSQDVQSYTRTETAYPYDVTVTRLENEGFGFVIISSVNRVGSTIGRIIEASPAERCGQLHVGDRILAVNHINITSLHHGDIVNLIKDSGYAVTLTIGAPIDDDSSTASVSHREEGVEDEQYHAVELNRGTRGFGFSIRGGREFQNMPLFVLQIAENGPAAIDNRLKVGDQIIEINGINTKNMTHAEAIEIIRNGGPTVRLLVRRGGRLPPPPSLEPSLRPSSSQAHSQSGDTGYWEPYPQN